MEDLATAGGAGTGDEAVPDEIEAAAARVARALRAEPDPGRQLQAVDWTVHQLAAHLATGAEAYAAMARGEPTFLTDLDRREELGRAAIAAEAGTPAPELAGRIESWSGELARALRRLDPAAPVRFYAGTVPAARLGALFLAELLVHGHDLGGVDLPPLAAGHAALGAVSVMPFVVRPGRRPRRARIAFRATGVGEAVVDLDGDTATVAGGAATGPIDVRLAADPVTLLLTAYGRLSPAAAMRRGLRVSGRRPWRLRALRTRFEPA